MQVEDILVQVDSCGGIKRTERQFFSQPGAWHGQGEIPSSSQDWFCPSSPAGEGSTPNPASPLSEQGSQLQVPGPSEYPTVPASYWQHGGSRKALRSFTPGSSLTGCMLVPKYPPTSGSLALLLPQPQSLSPTSEWLDPLLFSGPCLNVTSLERHPTPWPCDTFYSLLAFSSGDQSWLNLILSALLACLCCKLYLSHSFIHVVSQNLWQYLIYSRYSIKTCDWPDTLAPAYLLSKVSHHSPGSRCNAL